VQRSTFLGGGGGGQTRRRRLNGGGGRSSDSSTPARFATTATETEARNQCTTVSSCRLCSSRTICKPLPPKAKGLAAEGAKSESCSPSVPAPPAAGMISSETVMGFAAPIVE
jgi:hypothetical protein